MGITIVIVAGLTLATFFASFFDYLGKKKGRNDKKIEERIERLERQLAALGAGTAERDAGIAKLETDMSFLNKLIEDRR